jgi:hypothetical protein
MAATRNWLQSCECSESRELAESSPDGALAFQLSNTEISACLADRRGKEITTKAQTLKWQELPRDTNT